MSSLPLGVFTVFDGATLAAIPLALIAIWLGVRHLRNQTAEAPRKPKDVVHATRRWRARNFQQSLHYLREYGSASAYISAEPNVRAITNADLTAWGRSVLLTAASQISRYSQGKANLFVVNDVVAAQGSRLVTLRAKQFVGAFPIAQLTTRRTEASVYNYRDMPVNSSSTVAAAAANDDRIVFSPLGDAVGDHEKRLGTTHILAIPVCKGITDVEPGDMAVITVDFRLPRRVRVLWLGEAWLPKSRVLSRAGELQRATRAFVQSLPEGEH